VEADALLVDAVILVGSLYGRKPRDGPLGDGASAPVSAGSGRSSVPTATEAGAPAQEGRIEAMGRQAMTAARKGMAA
jgi:hypothetical protein